MARPASRGAAVGGVLGLKAYQNYQQGKAVQSAATIPEQELAQLAQSPLPHALPAADGNHPGERAYLDALAARLKLPAPLRAHLESQAGIV